MGLDITQKIEALLASKAQEQGLSVDAFLQRLLNNCGDLPAGTVGQAPVLPVRHLGVRGNLRRRDIYG
jgi:hypothetical protein